MHIWWAFSPGLDLAFGLMAEVMGYELSLSLNLNVSISNFAQKWALFTFRGIFRRTSFRGIIFGGKGISF